MTSASQFVPPTVAAAQLQICHNEGYQRRVRPANPTAKDIPEALHRDFGFSQLPEKFDQLVFLFNEMEKVLQIGYGREQRLTFAQITANVEKNRKRKFTLTHLGQINSIYPTAYNLKWEKPREKRAAMAGQWDLVVQLNLKGNQDILPFFSKKEGKVVANWAMPADERSPEKQSSHDSPLMSPMKLISPTKRLHRNSDFILRSPIKKAKPIVLCPSVMDTRVKMDPTRLLWRKLIFRHLLVIKVRQTHDAFLSERRLTHSDNQSVHPEFAKIINKVVPDISVTLPEQGKFANMKDTDIRTFFSSVEKKPIKESLEREKTPDRAVKVEPESYLDARIKSIEKRTQTTVLQTPERAVTKTPIKTPNTKIAKMEPSTPKTPSLEERFKLKFAAKATSCDSTANAKQKRRAILYKLEDTVVEIVRSHLNLERCSTVEVSNSRLLQKLGREYNPASLLEILQVLCEVAGPDVCCIESLAGPPGEGDQHFFKVSDKFGPDWAPTALEVVKKELALMESSKLCQTPNEKA